MTRPRLAGRSRVAPRFVGRSLLAGTCSLALLACAPPGAPDVRAPAAITAPAAPAIASDPAAAARIAADVRYLASPELAGRGTGDPGAKLAAAFIEQRFRSLGLQPFGDTTGGTRGYLQRFDAKVGASVDPVRVAIAIDGEPSVLGPGSAVTAEGSASGDVRGEAVFVGYGITASAAGWDDYAGLDVAGKIVVVLEGVPEAASPGDTRAQLRDFGASRYKLRTAREHQAAGVVIVARGALPPAPTDAASMGVPAAALAPEAAAPLLRALGLDAKAAWSYERKGDPRPSPWLAKRAPKKATIAVTTRVEPIMADAWNVVAMIPADPRSRHAAEHVVVGAHYDHLGHGGAASRAPGLHLVHPGGDDNASGTALVLEAARRLAALPSRPQRNLVFMAFGAEEIGALGSRYWVEHPPVAVGSIVAMINADMVGRLRDRKLLVDGVGTATGWGELLREASSGLDLALTLGGEGFGASDHASFTAARVPVAFLFTGVHDDYHMPTDTADRVHAEGVADVTTLAARLALSVSARGERLVFVDAPADPHRGMRGGFRVSLGTIPDYAYQGAGVRLSGLRPDSPAARAGAQAGDVIVRAGAHAITNIHDYVYALGELEPGREVEVEVLRGGAPVVLRVVPAPGR